MIEEDAQSAAQLVTDDLRDRNLYVLALVHVVTTKQHLRETQEPMCLAGLGLQVQSVRMVIFVLLERQQRA